MPEPPKIVCPSRGRAKTAITQNCIENLIFCVAEDQADLYKEHHPNHEIVVHPTWCEKPGPITKKWNWMLEYFGDAFYIDDDIKYCFCTARAAGEGNGKLSPHEAYIAVLQTHDIACQLGVYLYGWQPYNDVRNYFGLDPYRHGMMWNCGMGIRANAEGCKLTFDPSFRSHEDYYIWLLNCYHHRASFRNDLFSVLGATWTQEGGAAEYRTTDLEKESYEKLVEYFGNEVVVLKEDKPRSKRKTPFQITLRPAW